MDMPLLNLGSLDFIWKYCKALESIYLWNLSAIQALNYYHDD